nr:MAG TPA_asm: hypothetical protein [Caudoviricetes sp.]
MTTKRNGKYFRFPCLQKRTGRGSDRKTTGRLLSPLNTSKNKKPLTTTPIDFHRK